ncbi:MAG: hypothetical protein V1755_09135 [Chloroflexota bacterium]
MRALFSACLAGFLALAFSASTAAQGGPKVVDATITKDATRIVAAWGSKKGDRCCWYPKVQVFVKLAGAEEDDILQLEHLQGKKKWGEPQKCSPKRIDKTSGFVYFDCVGDKEMMINKAGNFAVRMTYKQTGAGKTHAAFATLPYKVTKYNAGGGKKPEPGFMVDHDFHMGEAWLESLMEGHGMNSTEKGHDPSEPIRLRIVTYLVQV